MIDEKYINERLQLIDKQIRFEENEMNHIYESIKRHEGSRHELQLALSHMKKDKEEK